MKLTFVGCKAEGKSTAVISKDCLSLLILASICDHPWEKGVWVNFGQYEIIASLHLSGLNASIYVD